MWNRSDGTVRIEPLGDHDRKRFTSAVLALDRYLVKQATQDIRRRVSNCLVARAAADGVLAAKTAATGVTEEP